jgi:DNA-binding transcriptional regulator GbsR (MarR family)
MLKQCAIEVQAEKDTNDITKERIHNMLDFVSTTSNWYEQIQAVPTSTLQKLMKLGSGITKFLKKK